MLERKREQEKGGIPGNEGKRREGGLRAQETKRTKGGAL